MRPEPLAVGVPAVLLSSAQRNRRWKDRHREKHLRHQRESAARRRAKFPEQIAREKARYTLAKHGLTIEQYDALVEEQGGRCAVCGTTEPGSRDRRFLIDHDHGHCPGDYSCGECIRGLLCRSCNFALGLLKDNADVVESAARYLRESQP